LAGPASGSPALSRQARLRPTWARFGSRRSSALPNLIRQLLPTCQRPNLLRVLTLGPDGLGFRRCADRCIRIGRGILRGTPPAVNYRGEKNGKVVPTPRRRPFETWWPPARSVGPTGWGGNSTLQRV
jgi:hypothetical protein